MKPTLIFLIASTSLLAADRTVTVYPGDRVEIAETNTRIHRDNIEVTRKTAQAFFDNRDAKDVVRALEILLKYAPGKYEEDMWTTSVTSGTWSYIIPARPTKADKLREEAVESTDRARLLREKAAKLDKEQEEIEWARGILAKWRLIASRDEK